jgi:hypothetical protein
MVCHVTSIYPSRIYVKPTNLIADGAETNPVFAAIVKVSIGRGAVEEAFFLRAAVRSL